MKWLVAVVVVTACDQRPPVRTCSDDLRGVWVAPGGERWAVLDHGTKLEAFAVFADAATGGAPRVIDLARGDTLAGEVKRRFTHGGEHCEARAPIRVTACTANELQIVIADPQPPLAFAPCTWGVPAPSRVERWRRE